ALRELPDLGPALEPALPQMVKLLNSGTPHAQVMAYYRLKQHDPDAVVKSDKALLEGDQQPRVKGKALAECLAQSHDRDPRKRSEALSQLAHFEYARLVVPALIERLDDEDLGVQKDAAAVIRRYPAAMDFMLAACACKDKSIRSRLLTVVASSL